MGKGDRWPYCTCVETPFPRACLHIFNILILLVTRPGTLRNSLAPFLTRACAADPGGVTKRAGVSPAGVRGVPETAPCASSSIGLPLAGRSPDGRRAFCMTLRLSLAAPALAVLPSCIRLGSGAQFPIVKPVSQGDIGVYVNNPHCSYALRGTIIYWPL